MKRKMTIIGGGIAGLTLERCISDDYKTHIIERKQEFGEVGAALDRDRSYFLEG